MTKVFDQNAEITPASGVSGIWRAVVMAWYVMMYYVMFKTTSVNTATILYIVMCGMLCIIGKLVRFESIGAYTTKTAGEILPIIVVLFALRTFIAEPFIIPSSSMRPGLLPGDYILTSKFSYGLRVPGTNVSLMDTGSPQRGDVVVFHHPTAKTEYIKRIIGLPGDTVQYENKHLTINDKEVVIRDVAGNSTFEDEGERFQLSVRQESYAGHTYKTLVDNEIPTVRAEAIRGFKGKEYCSYNMSGFKCIVPRNEYFMMGDNRDYSSDSRYWGFVNNKDIIGKAVVILFNFKTLSRFFGAI